MKHTHSLRMVALAILFAALALSHLAVVIDAYQWPSMAARVISPASENSSAGAALKRRLNRMLRTKNLQSTRKSPRTIRAGIPPTIDRSLKNAAGVKAGCGDGLVTGAEKCDDRNTVAKDGCSSTCTVEAGSFCNSAQPSICWFICRDGIVATAEQCDDGNAVDTDGCTNQCKIGLGFDCTGSPSVCKPKPSCGDGTKNGSEECDDGNTSNYDGCSSSCTNEPRCGDGTKNGTEDCDDGNLTNGDGCSSSCDSETPQ